VRVTAWFLPSGAEEEREDQERSFILGTDVVGRGEIWVVPVGWARVINNYSVHAFKLVLLYFNCMLEVGLIFMF
jgi:hypothetical protein